MKIPDKNEINLLVVPSAYPDNDQDVKGVFIKDYIEAVKTQCSVRVFFQILTYQH